MSKWKDKERKTVKRMSGGNNQKLKLLALMNIFYQETDDEHPLNAMELCEKLNEKKIEAERKSIYTSIQALISYGMDINQMRSPHQGFYLGKRDFELAEVRILMDAVMTAPFITAKKTRELLLKLSGLLSKYQAKDMKNQFYIDESIKFDNEQIYYNIDTIHQAISKNRKITFLYYHKKIVEQVAATDEGRRFTISPYALVWSNDKYYLVGNYEKYDNLVNYRLDRIKSVQLTSEPARPFQEVCEYTRHFDVADYLKKSINMYSGKQSEVDLICDNSMIEAIIDRFGRDILLYCDKDQKNHSNFMVHLEVYSSDGLVEWLVQHGDRVYVQSPYCLRKQVIDRVKEIEKVYKKGEINYSAEPLEKEGKPPRSREKEVLN